MTGQSDCLSSILSGRHRRSSVSKQIRRLRLHMFLDEIHNVAGRCAWGEYLGNARCLQRRDVALGDDATADDEDEPEEQDDKSKLRPLPRRGPEITEIG